MSGPVLHHRAIGIHPAAFVGPAPPSTADVQDGVLWVDTSSGPPYALQMWDDSTGLWRDVGGLPPGALGDLLVHGASGWLILPPGPETNELTMVQTPAGLLPQWAPPCCGADDGRGNGGGGPLPLPGGPAGNQQRCGAVLAMATWLEQYYANVKTWAAAAGGTAAVFLLSYLGSVLAEAATAAGLEGAGLANQGALLKAAQWLLGVLAGSYFFSTLTSADNEAIMRYLWCALPSDGPTLTVTADALDWWAGHLAGDSVMGADDTGPLLSYLIHVPTLAQWQDIANAGLAAPSSLCAAFSCGTQRALEGGATYGVAVRRALQGGATSGVPARRATQGGGAYGYSLRCIRGGATII